VNEPPQRVVDDDELVDARPAEIAGVAACAAPLRRVKRKVALQTEIRQELRFSGRRRRSPAASGAKRTDQPLRQHTEKARRQQIRLDAHVARRVTALAASLV
jgi:hypothetical protein